MQTSGAMRREIANDIHVIASAAKQSIAPLATAWIRSLAMREMTPPPLMRAALATKTAHQTGQRRRWTECRILQCSKAVQDGPC